MRTPRAAARVVVIVAASSGLAVALAGCSPKVAHLVNPAAPRCQESLRAAFGLMLVKANESPDVADEVAAREAQSLADTDLGPKPFKLTSPSGWQYAVFFDDEMGRCLVHLVAMQKGPMQYSNNVTFLDTRALPGCKCVE